MSTPSPDLCRTLSESHRLSQLHPDHLRTKLSIYDSKPSPATLTPVTSLMQPEVAFLRHHIEDYYVQLSSDSSKRLQTWMKWEGDFVGRMKQLVPAAEVKSSAPLYVAIASLASSIIVKNRSIMIRGTLPPLVFAMSTAYYLPNSFDNISSYLTGVPVASRLLSHFRLKEIDKKEAGSERL